MNPFYTASMPGVDESLDTVGLLGADIDLGTHRETTWLAGLGPTSCDSQSACLAMRAEVNKSLDTIRLPETNESFCRRPSAMP
jgi:hypothetical protein